MITRVGCEETCRLLDVHMMPVTTHVEVMYDCIISDHHPVLLKSDLNILAELGLEHSNDLKQHIHWDKLSMNVI